NHLLTIVISVGSPGTSTAHYGSVKRLLALGILLACWAAPVFCATLERLSFEDLATRSTMIVRGKVGESWAAMTNGIIYTHYKIQVTESLKGGSKGSVEVMVPGGTVNGLRQAVSGSPVLNSGDEFVFFLWTSKAGITWITGLTQGLFALP